jgi:TRAP-type C4-dicarboxylate transport system permease small subunit
MLSRLILALDRRITAAVWLMAALLLGLLACIGLYQVLTRFIWNQPSPWSEELIGRLFVWCVMLGVVAAFRQGALVSVDLMLRLSRGAWHRFVRRLILGVTLAFLAVLAWYGFDLAWRIRFQTFATLPLSIAWAYLAMPIGALFSMLAVLANHVEPINRELELQK